MAAARIDQMQQIITALQQSLTEVTQEVVNLRATVTTSGAVLIALQATANAAWDTQATRMDTLEEELENARALIARAATTAPRNTSGTLSTRAR